MGIPRDRSTTVRNVEMVVVDGVDVVVVVDVGPGGD